MAYSKDLKERVLAYVKSGGSKAEAARLFSISRDTIFTWLKQGPDHVPGVPGPKSSRKIDRDALAELVSAQPDLMIKEIAQILQAKPSTVHRNLQRLGFRRKKNTALRAGSHPQGATTAQTLSPKAPTPHP